jgi:plasmid stabilization system protein ParE
MRVEYHPEAAEDLNGATDHHNSIRAGLGDKLRVEVYGAIERLAQNPSQYRIVESEIRRCFVHRFPYSVLFRVVSPDLVRILAIRHHRQHEQFGLQRK